MPSARLLIISHTPHYRSERGVVGWAPTVREIDHLASRFASVRHIACLYSAIAPASAIAYAQSNVQLVPVPPAGAEGFVGKLDVLRVSPNYVTTIARELEDADVVHVRAPANIALIAMLVLRARRRRIPCWFKYAGDWSPANRESMSYTAQRWWLSNVAHRGIVTVNGSWPDQPPFVRTFVNPSLDDAQLVAGRESAAARSASLPLRLVYVGALTEGKGAARALDVLEQVRADGVDARMELAGDGGARGSLERRISERSLDNYVSLLGWQSTAAVHAAYARAHIIVHPSSTEGWPKVLSEAMAHGVVPVASDVGSIAQTLDLIGAGKTFPPTDVAGFARAIVRYAHSPSLLSEESRRALAGAERFSFRAYLEAVDRLLVDLGVSA